MKPSKFNKLCKKWEVNPNAMEDKLKDMLLQKEINIKKDISDEIFISCLYIYAPELFYCRYAGNDIVEYQNPALIKKLTYATNKLRGA